MLPLAGGAWARDVSHRDGDKMRRVKFSETCTEYSAFSTVHLAQKKSDQTFISYVFTRTQFPPSRDMYQDTELHIQM